MLTQMISADAVGGGIPSAVARALGGGRRRAADDFALHSLHPGIRVAEAPVQSPRITRKRWAREVEKP